MSSVLRQIKTVDEFDELLATATKPVLVDVSATWCAPCQRLTPILEDFAASTDVVDVVTIDADDPRALSWRLGGGSIPRMFLFDRGVLQMQVVGVRDQAWLNDVVAGYPALGITEPDGLTLPPRTLERHITLPEPTVGHVGLLVVNGHDNGFRHDITAPAYVDVTAGTITVLMVSPDAIMAGYLELLDPTWIDQVRITGPVTAAVVERLTTLFCLQSVQGSAMSEEHTAQIAKVMEEGGDVRALYEEFASQSMLTAQDLAPLASLPLLRRVQITSAPPAEELLPHVIGSWWLAPGVAAARRAKGLPEYEGDEEPSDAQVEVGCLLKHRDDGTLELTLNLTVGEGWYAFPPGSDEGVPVSLAINSEHEVVEDLAAESPGAHLSGKSTLTAVLRGPDEVRLDVTVQVCEGTVCMAPVTTQLVVPLMHKG